MIRILYLDPFSGISGDMFIGALLDLGLDLARLHHELAKLKLTGYHLSHHRVMRGVMAGSKFDVEISGVLEKEGDAKILSASEEEVLSHAHGHSHGHEHGHSHASDSPSHSPHPPHSLPQRGFLEIQALLNASALSDRVKSESLRVFTHLAKAEAAIHGMKMENVQFHEVGALDSIIDIIGGCVGLELLGIDEVWSAPVALGSGGFVRCEHGLLPVPTPATLEIMKGIPTRPSPVEKELTTPTGAALVAGLCQNFGPMPAMTIERIGYGAGSREIQAVPNLLRVVLGTHEPSPISVSGSSTTDKNSENSDTILEINVNLDDSTAEVLSYLSEKLLIAGVLDVFSTPIQMKKNRLATQISVLIEPPLLDAVAEILFKESSTFGLRYSSHSRLKLSRRMVSVQTSYGEVPVKLGLWKGQVVSLHPEFEVCKTLAIKNEVPLQKVIAAARVSAELRVTSKNFS